jgi:histidinol-phosphate aminotransferase
LEIGQIQIASGASAVLERLNKMFVGPGSKVLGYSPQFTEYITEVEVCGGKYQAVVLNPEEDFKFYVERLLARIGEEYCLIYIDNPNNPTGQVIDLKEIEKVIQQAKTKDVTVVIDEAYGDYIGRESSAVNLINKYNNLVVVRSFSKGFGLAGLRVGYGVFSPELSRYYQKINLPFSVSSVGCYLAREALLDQKFIHDCRVAVQREKRRLIQELRGKGYLTSETFESCPIFVLGCKDRDTNLRKELQDKGILTVAGTDFRNLGSNYVRVNIPARAEEFLAHL